MLFNKLNANTGMCFETLNISQECGKQPHGGYVQDAVNEITSSLVTVVKKGFDRLNNCQAKTVSGCISISAFLHSMQHTQGQPDAWLLSVHIKEMDVVHVVTYPARISTPEYAGGWGLFKLWCSKCSALSPVWSSHIVWQMEEAEACRQLGMPFWSNRLLATCRSEAKQSSCNSSHTLPDKQCTVNIDIHIYESTQGMLILTQLGKKT